MSERSDRLRETILSVAIDVIAIIVASYVVFFKRPWTWSLVFAALLALWAFFSLIKQVRRGIPK